MRRDSEISGGSFDVLGRKLGSVGQIRFEQRVVRQGVEQTRTTSTELVEGPHGVCGDRLRAPSTEAQTMGQIVEGVLLVERPEKYANINPLPEGFFVTERNVELRQADQKQ